jgi:sugar-specific transcriptional regulator TrmB
MRNDTYKTIETLQKLIAELITKYEDAAVNRDAYLADLNRTKKELQNAKNKIAEQEKKLEHIELEEAFLNTSSGDKQAKARIGKIIKEIDKCISLLND